MSKAAFYFLILLSSQSQAQRSYSFSLFNNATQLPMASFSAVWKQPLHPGIAVGYDFHWKENSPWFQTVKIAFYYHQFVQSAIQVYTDFGYRKAWSKGFFAEASVCLGYLHAIPLTEQARLNQNGNYEIKNGAGRAQIMFGLTPGVGYEFTNADRKVAVFINYQIWMQSPFVRDYVPLLPNGAVHIGGRFAIHKKSVK